MKNSKIEWTDHTWNPWVGCTRVSPGCQHCYAETMMDKRYGKVQWGPQGTRVRTSAAYWKQPLKWNRAAAAEGVRRRVFCASLADVFEDKPDQPELDESRRDLFNLISETQHLDWLLLTKRPENVMSMLIKAGRGFQPLPPWAWIGTSVENQEYADKRIPELLKIPATVRFLSVEPMVGPVDLSAYLTPKWTSEERLSPKHGIGFPPTLDVVRIRPRVDWVIVGGESGHGARPMHPQWARDIRDQCENAGVPFFFKQHGEWRYRGRFDSEMRVYQQLWIDHDTLDAWERAGKKAAGRLLDGREWNEFPLMK